MQLDPTSLWTTQASTAFKRKDYRKALAIYKELSARHGNNLFSANISLCLKWLALEEGGKDQTINTLKIEADRPTANPPKELGDETNISHQLISSDSPLHRKCNQPHWLSIAVEADKN